MNPAVHSVRWRLATPARAGAIAIIELTAEDSDLNDALDRIGIAPLNLNAIQLCNLAGIDQGLAARWSDTLVHLMPHGGPAVVRALVAALTDVGIDQSPSTFDLRAHPEAADEIEARMLDALARAQSPLAIDRLLDQPCRWRGLPHESLAPIELDRLINPPLVVVRGPPNVGKSTLVNALAGRTVSVVADEPGTTRDHVGITVNLAGLVVRLLDLPGQREATGPEAQAITTALTLAETADLTLSCGSPNLPPDPIEAPHLRLALKSDLAPAPWEADHHLSALTGIGLKDLVIAVRDRLVPPAALADERPWRFWADPD